MNNPPNSIWTTTTLKAYLEERLDALEKLIRAEIALRDRAIDLARNDVNRRLEGMNELRAQIERERGTYMTRDLYDRLQSEAKGSAGSMVGWVIGALGVITAIAAIIVSQ